MSATARNADDDIWLDPLESPGYLVRDTNIAVGKALRRRLAQYGMTLGQYYFMRALWIEEGLSQRELSRRVGTTEPTTASVLRLLERNGLVRRVRNRRDRRTINIFPTQKGRNLKNELLRGASRIGLPPEQVSISQDDEDAVDLVGMLFDVMFEERDFEQAARALIARLVVPFVKAAVMDRRLFLFKTHPARRLLNSLAEAVEGNRGEGPQERELLQKAESTVDRLVAEFNEDLAIFETLEQELRQFLEQHRRRVELAERRAAEAQRGQERLEQARELAATELEKRTAGLSPTPAMQDFLSRTWTHHLSMIALREGPDSGSWKSALDVADRLLGLLPRDGQPSADVAAAMKELREPLENVLASSGVIGESAHDVIRAIAESLEHPEREVALPVTPATDEDKVVPMPERRNPAAAAAAALADLKPRLEVVGGKAGLKINDADVEQMRQLKIGTWIHIAGEDGRHHPVKLSWVSPISSRLMFVNRRGVRVLVASVEELAAMKQEGNLLVREQEGVFDQVLHRVMGKLRDEAEHG